MTALDQFILGLTFLGLAMALALGSPWLAAFQALAAAVYFLADPLSEGWSAFRRLR